MFPVTRAPETRGVAHRSGSFTNLDHRLGFQGLAGDHRVDSGGLWGVGRVEGQPSSVGRGRFAAFRHQVDKTHSTDSPAIRGWETHRHAKSAGVRDVAAEANGSGGHGESSHCFASQNDGGAQKNRPGHVVRDAFSIRRRGSLFPALFRLERMPRSYGISQTKNDIALSNDWKHVEIQNGTRKSNDRRTPAVPQPRAPDACRVLVDAICRR